MNEVAAYKVVDRHGNPVTWWARAGINDPQSAYELDTATADDAPPELGLWWTPAVVEAEEGERAWRCEFGGTIVETTGTVQGVRLLSDKELGIPTEVGMYLEAVLLRAYAEYEAGLKRYWLDVLAQVPATKPEEPDPERYAAMRALFPDVDRWVRLVATIKGCNAEYVDLYPDNSGLREGPNAEQFVAQLVMLQAAAKAKATGTAVTAETPKLRRGAEKAQG